MARCQGDGVLEVIRSRLGVLLAWLVPLVVVLEFVGSTFGSPLLATVGFASLLVGAAWFASPESHLAQQRSAERARPGRWLVGIMLLTLGGGLVLPTLLALAGEPTAARGIAPSVDPDLQALLPVLGVWSLVVGWAWVSERRLNSSDLMRLGLFVAVVFLGLVASGQRVQRLPVVSPQAAPALGLTAVVLVVMAALPRLPMAAQLAVLGVLGVAVRVFGLEAWEPNPVVRDMLPLVEDAQRALLRGAPPYAIYQMQRGSLVPLTYFPGLWLLSLPATAAGLDLRFVSILADLAVVGALGWVARGVAEPQRRAAEYLAVALSAVWCFSPSVQWNVVYAEPHPWWGVLALTTAAFIRRRFWLGAALLGLGLGTRQFALVLVPFAMVLMVKELGWRGAAARLGLAGAVTATLLVPFVGRDPQMFWFGTVRWLWDYGPAHQDWFYEKYGFSGTLYHNDRAGWMSLAQAASIVVMSVIAAVVRRRRAVLAALVTAYVGVVMNNRIIWDSFYLDIFVLLACVVVGAESLLVARAESVTRDVPVSGAPNGEAARPGAWLVHGVGGLALVGSLMAGAYVLNTLRVVLDETGRSRVAEELSRRATRGDLIVDRADWRLAFVRGEWLVDPSSTEARVAGELFDRSLAPRGPLGFHRIWLATREDRDSDLRARVRRLGPLLAEESHGRYSLIGVSLYPKLVGLADRLADAEIDLRQNGRSIAGGRPGPSGWKGPGDVAVSTRECRLGGGRWPAVFAQPMTGATLSIRWPAVKLGDRLLVLGGIEDPVVVWDRANVTVDLDIDGQNVGRVDAANRPGVSWNVVDTRRWSGKTVAVALRLTTNDDAQRWTCVDAVAMGSAPR